MQPNVSKLAQCFIIQQDRVAYAVCFGSLSLFPTQKCCPISFVTFGSIWVEIIAMYTSEFMLLLIYISTNISDSFPLTAKQSHAITLPPPCLANIVVWLDVPLGCNVFEMDTRYDLSTSQWPFADSRLSWRCFEMLHTHGLWEPWASHHRGTQTCLRGVSSLSPDLVSSEGDWSRRKRGTRVQSPWDISDCPSAESICCQMGAVSKICGSVLLLCTVVDPSVSHGEGQRYNIQYLIPIPSSSSSSFCGIWCPLLPTACCLDNTTQFLLEWCLHRNVCRLWLIMWAAHQCPLPVTPRVFAK